MTPEEFDAFADELREKVLNADADARGFALVILSKGSDSADPDKVKEDDTVSLCAFGVLDHTDERRWALIDTLFEFADSLDTAFPRPRHLNPSAN